MTFGKYLKSLRKSRRLTLREVGDKCGVSNAYLSQLEQGIKEPPHPKILKKLAPVYQVSLDDLMQQVGYVSKV